MRALLPALSAVAFSALAVPAEAEIAEIRFGLLYHDIGLLTSEREDGLDVNAEVLFDSPGVLAAVFSPRPHLGVSVNTSGDTSQAYGGLTWTWDVSRAVFVDISLGFAVHNGETEAGNPNRAALGSPVLFRESLEQGFRVTDRDSVSLMLDHISNANLAENNGGLDNYGIRWGRRF